MIKQWIGPNPRRALKRSVLVAICIALPVIAWAQWTTSSNDIYNSNSGNVGIGATSLNTRLHVKGADNNSYGQFEIESTGNDARLSLSNADGAATTGRADILMSRSSSYEGLRFMINNSDKMIVASNGNVGIGMTWPGTKLDIMTSGVNAAAFRAMDSGGAQTYIIPSLGSGSGNSLSQSGDTGIMFSTSGGIDTGALVIAPWASSGIGMRIDSGSGTTIGGNLTVSGNIAAKYQDLAEWVPAAQQIAPGTVVIQDPDGINSVMASTESYDTRVAGVVSASPGIVLGEAGAGKVRVATTGRVKVHVDSSHGPIHAGDLLVTSDKAGTAMRSEPVDVAGIKMHRPGTLIGKALEPLSSGEGDILVLLSLQ